MSTTKIFLFLLTILGINFAYSQKYSEHYYERVALFVGTPDTENEIIFLGNSITESGDWKGLFKGINVVNRGISGDVTLGILNRLDEVVSSKPSKTFLLIGINDLARGKSVAHVTQNIEEITKRIKTASPNTQLYLQSVLPVNPKVGNRFKGHKSKQSMVLQVNDQIIAIAKKNNVTFIDLHKQFRNSKGVLKPKYTHDGLHLNQKGYRRWKRYIAKYL